MSCPPAPEGLPRPSDPDWWRDRYVPERADCWPWFVIVCLVAGLVFGLTLPMPGDGAGRPEEGRDAAIRYVEEARDVHVRWEERLASIEAEEERAEVEGAVGGADYHREWVRRYDVVLAELRR